MEGIYDNNYKKKNNKFFINSRDIISAIKCKNKKISINLAHIPIQYKKTFSELKITKIITGFEYQIVFIDELFFKTNLVIPSQYFNEFRSFINTLIPTL